MQKQEQQRTRMPQGEAEIKSIIVFVVFIARTISFY
jgi:hypothetical protein